jgi:hypothetical protein
LVVKNGRNSCFASLVWIPGRCLDGHAHIVSIAADVDAPPAAFRRCASVLERVLNQRKQYMLNTQPGRSRLTAEHVRRELQRCAASNCEQLEHGHELATTSARLQSVRSA